jgi:hypothetical protein
MNNHLYGLIILTLTETVLIVPYLSFLKRCNNPPIRYGAT